MSAATCPHCTNSIPPEFSSMPICYMCGGDLKATPSAPVWSSVDIRTDNTRTCKKCNESIKSVLALTCPNCGADVPPPGAQVDAEEEKIKFENAVTASNRPVEPKPEPVKEVIAVPLAKETPKPVQEPVKEIPKEVPKQKPVVEEKPEVKEGFFSKLLRMLGLKK